jgi:hypothetical protein
MNNKLNEGFKWLEKILELSKKYSFMDIIKSILLFVFMGYMVFLTFNIDVLIKRYEESKDKEHAENLMKRMSNSPLIKNELENILYSIGADRVFLIEFHNSIKSVEGYPYAYGSMNYEIVSDSTMYVSDEYTNFSLTKYDMISYMLKNNLFVGNVDAVKPIDNRLHLKFLSNNMAELAMIVVEGVDLPLGILGISYNNEGVMPDVQAVKAMLRKEALKMSLYLTQ